MDGGHTSLYSLEDQANKTFSHLFFFFSPLLPPHTAAYGRRHTLLSDSRQDSNWDLSLYANIWGEIHHNSSILRRQSTLHLLKRNATFSQPQGWQVQSEWAAAAPSQALHYSVSPKLSVLIWFNRQEWNISTEECPSILFRSNETSRPFRTCCSLSSWINEAWFLMTFSLHSPSPSPCPGIMWVLWWLINGKERTSQPFLQSHAWLSILRKPTRPHPWAGFPCQPGREKLVAYIPKLLMLLEKCVHTHTYQ